MRWYVDLSVFSCRSLSSLSIYSELLPTLEETLPTLSLIDAMLDEIIVNSCLFALENDSHVRFLPIFRHLVVMFLKACVPLLSKKDVQ